MTAVDPDYEPSARTSSSEGEDHHHPSATHSAEKAELELDSESGHDDTGDVNRSLSKE